MDDGLRGLAIEWLVSYVEKRRLKLRRVLLAPARVKFLSKSVPDFINLTLECCPSLFLKG